jgi:hypothetical protein
MALNHQTKNLHELFLFTIKLLLLSSMRGHRVTVPLELYRHRETRIKIHDMATQITGRLTIFNGTSFLIRTLFWVGEWSSFWRNCESRKTPRCGECTLRTFPALWTSPNHRTAAQIYDQEQYTMMEIFPSSTNPAFVVAYRLMELSI